MNTVPGPRPFVRVARRAAFVLVAVAAIGVAAAGPAAADAAKPTNYRSTFEGFNAPTSGVSLRVVGGDGFLSLHVERGHTVAVPGYQDEPWLRVSANGRVEENRHSAATYLNENRDGRVTIPPEASDPRATPEWKVVGGNGSFVWHDHRIHWMNPGVAPPMMPGTRQVRLGTRPDGRWEVPMVVDGRRVAALGTLESLPAPSPLLPIAGMVVVAVLGAALAVPRRALAVARGALLLAASGGLAGGFAQLRVVPAAAGGNPLDVVLPLVAFVALGLSLLFRNRATQAIALFCGAGAVLGWAALRIDSLDKAVPLSALPAGLARALVGAVIGLGIATIVGIVRSRALALPQRT